MPRQALGPGRAALRAQSRFAGEVVAGGDGVDVHSRAAAQYRHHAACADVRPDAAEVLLILEDVVLRPGGEDVYQVIGDFSVFGEVFARADVHTFIYLARVGGDDLCTVYYRRVSHSPRAALEESEGCAGVDLICQLHGIARLAGGGGAEHDYQVHLPVEIFAGKRAEVDFFRLREFGYDWLVLRHVRTTLFRVRAGYLSL